MTKLDELRALLERATPGPWGYDSRPGIACHIWVPAERLAMIDGDLAYKGVKEDIADLRTGAREEDAALIVAAVNALPELLSTIERLQARVTELEIELGINEQRNAEISELAGEPVDAFKMVKPKRRKFRNARKAIQSHQKGSQ